MKVVITEGCSRCKRQAPREVESSELAQIEEAAAKRTIDRDAVVQYLKDQKNAPDLIVYFKGEVRTMDKVCAAFCTETVTRNIELIFRDIDATKRKTRTPKEPVDSVEPDGTKKSKGAGKTKTPKE